MNHPNPIIDGFRNLTDFRGRTSRKRFWPYAGTVIGGYWAIGTILGMAMVVPMMSRAFAVVRANPQGAPINPAAMMPDMGPLMWVSWATQLAAAVLLAAAVTRRLHDRGLTGFLGLLPVPASLISMALMWNTSTARLIAAAADPGTMGWRLANSAFFWVSLGILIVLLILPGRAEANRFGLPPFDGDR